MSQKTKILGFKVTGSPYLGSDADGMDLFAATGEQTAKWLTDSARTRFNQCRSVRSKYIYADGEPVLDSSGERTLTPIVGTVLDLTNGQARAQFSYLAAVPAMILHYANREEQSTWFAAVKRRKTNRAKGLPAGSMPRFRARRRSPATFGIFANNGSTPTAVFLKTGKRSGILSFGGVNPTGKRAPGHGAKWTLKIRVRVSEPVRPFTSVRVDLDRGELVFVNPAKTIDRVRTGRDVGLDLGVTIDVATSDDHAYRRPDTRDLTRQLKQVQRTMARQKRAAATEHRNFRESNRYQQSKAAAAALYARIDRVQTDWRHKTTTQLVHDYDTITIEDLKVANMTRKGPGKRGLNRGMAAASPAALRAMLEYKAKASGVTVTAVAAHHTSQRCHQCTHIAKENRESQAVFLCVQCGYHGNADHNAARNILDRKNGLWGRAMPPRVRTGKTGTGNPAPAPSDRPRQPRTASQ